MEHWFKRLYWRLEILFRKTRAEAELRRCARREIRVITGTLAGPSGI